MSRWQDQGHERNGSRISWNTDRNGDYDGGGHTVNPDKSINNW